jgi:hypothetical protein
MNSQLVEIASWYIISELYLRYPERFRVIETHPGDGTYDCLSLYDERSVKIADFNRVGRFHVFNRCDGSRELPEPIDVWRQIIEVDDSKEVFDQVCSMLGLPPSPDLLQRTTSTIVYRFIATFLTHALFGPQRWTCHNGFYDASDESGVRDDFAKFPEASARLQVTSEEDLAGQPAYRFWFLQQGDEPVLCLETSGMVWSEDGTSFNLALLYQEEPRIWSVVMQVAGKFMQ